MTPPQSAEATASMTRLAHVFYEEMLNQGKMELLDQLLSPDFVNHPGELDTIAPGVEAFRGVLIHIKTAFPNLHFTIHDTVAQTDRLAVRWTMEGTHLNPLNDIPATGKRITGYGITIFVLKDGKIAELWSQTDRLGMIQQLFGHDPKILVQGYG
jgi:steroid delta-isomerase-like uncharacterized protein